MIALSITIRGKCKNTDRKFSAVHKALVSENTVYGFYRENLHTVPLSSYGLYIERMPGTEKMKGQFHLCKGCFSFLKI